jgi:hypothetical protein
VQKEIVVKLVLEGREELMEKLAKTVKEESKEHKVLEV